MKFSLRDLLLVTVIVALAGAWGIGGFWFTTGRLPRLADIREMVTGEDRFTFDKMPSPSAPTANSPKK